MKNVCFIGSPHGGIWRFTQELVTHLSSEFNFDVYLLLLPNESKPTYDINLLKDKAEVKVFRVPFPYAMSELTAIFDMILRKYDLVHTSYAAASLLVFLKNQKPPLIYTNHGIIQPWAESSKLFLNMYRIEYGLLRTVANRASEVITVSNFCKKLLRQKYDVESKVIYHGVDTELFKPTNNRSEVKRRLRLRTSDDIILFVGRLHPVKDPLTLVNSIPLILKDHPKTKIIFIGEGPLRGHILSIAKKLKVAHSIILKNFMPREKLIEYLNASSVLVFPSVNEGFGFILVEGMACGTPIVASNSGACSEIIAGAGLLFEPGDCEDLVNKVLAILQNPDLARKLSLKGGSRVKLNFTLDKFIGDYLDLYRKYS